MDVPYAAVTSHTSVVGSVAPLLDSCVPKQLVGVERRSTVARLPAEPAVTTDQAPTMCLVRAW